MKAIMLKIVAYITYYPRYILDSIIYAFIRNDYSLLNIFESSDCLIVGNGPSINSTELELINMPSIGMNKINLLFEKTSWRPDLVVCINGLVNKTKSIFFKYNKHTTNSAN